MPDPFDPAYERLIDPGPPPLFDGTRQPFNDWVLLPSGDDLRVVDDLRDDVWLCPECVTPEERQAVKDYWRRVAEVTPADDPSDPRFDDD